ncbi:hypothetical protein K402DRAFT_16387 [Aulographum hederae CBS 113979]|uniref:Secreted protein n=1 Tax=Aulographum hederae CBS 113979 TaxID=1176131 RepID=A0A6G1H854_9PEZI|nr:hypothetical protein K402DRAFT_16387 [Aulographum hederae CBS 113979]
MIRRYYGRGLCFFVDLIFLSSHPLTPFTAYSYHTGRTLGLGWLLQFEITSQSMQSCVGFEYCDQRTLCFFLNVDQKSSVCFTI